MTKALSPAYVDQLQHCLKLVQNSQTQDAAHREFERLHQAVSAETPDAAQLLAIMWDELVSSRRSAMFWEELCNVEKQLTDRMAESHLRLRQNYLRLMQEQ
ncbi:MAG: hypothetical protein VKK04_09240 [Synechococcales bacterium]|nr:hypothetical protein [Synechococcales bacterium]